MNFSAKIFGRRDQQTESWDQSEASKQSTVGRPSLKIPKIIELSQQSQQTTP